MAALVEVMGLPGAGKSTLSGALALALRARGAEAWERREAVRGCLRRRPDGRFKSLLKRLPAALWEPWIGVQSEVFPILEFAAGHPGLLRLLADWVDRPDWEAEQRYGILWAFAKLFAETELLRQHGPGKGAVIFDEGFAHRGFSLFGYLCTEPVPARVCADYVALVPAPYAVLWVDTDVETCARRLAGRAALPLLARGDNPVQLERRLQQGRVVLERIGAAFRERGVPVWRLENHDGRQGDAERQLAEDIVPSILEIPGLH